MNLIIRADAGTKIGTGHVMRCLALAQCLQYAGGTAVFVMAMESPVLEARLKKEGMDVVLLKVRPGSSEDATQTAELAKTRYISWVVTDGYHFGAKYQKIMKDSGLRLLCIDDNVHAGHYYGDIILNQNIHATESLYVKREPSTRLLLGSRYVLLRREFLKWQGWKREIRTVASKVLVTLGGGDPDNVTLKTIRAMNRLNIEDTEIIVILGPSNPHRASLKKSIGLSHLNLKFLSSVERMSHLMAWADAAFCAGGSTCWELAYMGIPFSTVILAENQKNIAEELDKAGASVNLGWFKDLSEEELAKGLSRLIGDEKTRQSMSNIARGLVDGKGAERVIERIVRF